MNSFQIVDTIIQLCKALMSAFGNSLVVISVIKFEWLRTSTNYFVALLAFFDFWGGIPLNISLQVTAIIDSVDEKMTSSFEISCKIYALIMAFSACGDLLAILVITIDRHLYINYPLRYHTIVTNTRALAVSALCFVFAGIVSLTSTEWSKVRRPCISQNIIDVEVMTYLMVPLLLYTLLLVVVVYGRIAYVAWKAKKSTVQPTTQNMQWKSQGKMTKVLSLVISAFMTTYITYFISFYITATTDITGRYTFVVQSTAAWIWQVIRRIEAM